MAGWEDKRMSLGNTSCWQLLGVSKMEDIFECRTGTPRLSGQDKFQRAVSSTKTWMWLIKEEIKRQHHELDCYQDKQQQRTNSQCDTNTRIVEDGWKQTSSHVNLSATCALRSEIKSVVNDIYKSYCRYRYRYFLMKVSPIPIIRYRYLLKKYRRYIYRYFCRYFLTL